MNNPSGDQIPARGSFLAYGMTRGGTVLANLRFWLATVIGLTLLVLSFVFAADGSLSMMYVWLAFTLLWIGWAFVV